MTHPTSNQCVTAEQIAEYRELVPLGSLVGVGGKLLAQLLDEIEYLRPMAESWESYEAAQARKAEMGLTDETKADIDEGKLWSFLRDVMTTGCAIETDTRAHGRGYEEHSARLDAAARDAIPQFFKRLGLSQETSINLDKELRKRDLALNGKGDV